MSTGPEWEPQFPAGTSVVEIPFRDEMNTILIDMSINGSDPVAFVVDTGTYDVVLMKPQAMKGLIENPGSGGETWLARDLDFEMGSLRFTGVEMAVMPEGALKNLGTTSWDGILGAPFFENLVVEVDWEKSILRLHDPATFKAPETAAVVPIEKRRAHIYVTGEVTIDGNSRPVDLIVDTGSTGALALRSDNVPVPARRISDLTLARSLFGDIKGDIGRIDKLQLGGSSLQGVVSIFVAGSSGIISVGSDGNLGVKILRRFGVTFDYAGSRMLLEPTAAVSDPFPFSTSGLQLDLKIDEDGSVLIKDVYADSPAAKAGVGTGDRLLTVNAKPVRELGIDAIRDLLRQAPGTRIKLEVQQGDSWQEIELELATIL